MQGTWVWSLDQEDPLEKEMATHSAFLPGESQGREAWWAAVYGSHRVGRNWSDLAALAAAAERLTLPHCPLLIFSMRLFISLTYLQKFLHHGHGSWLFIHIMHGFGWCRHLHITSGKMLLQQPPWFQDGQCSDKTVKVEDGGWWKERVCPQPPLMVKAVTDALRKKQATWRRDDCLALPTMPFGLHFFEAGFSTKEGKFAFYRFLCGTNE